MSRPNLTGIPQGVLQHALLRHMTPSEVSNLANTAMQLRVDTHNSLDDIRRGDAIFEDMRCLVYLPETPGYEPLTGLYGLSDQRLLMIQFLSSMSPPGTAERLLGNLFEDVEHIADHPLMQDRDDALAGWFDYLRQFSTSDMSVWTKIPLLRKWKRICADLEVIARAIEGEYAYNTDRSIIREYIKCIIYHKQFEELVMTDRLPHQVIDFAPWEGIGGIVHTVMASWTEWERRNEPYVIRLLSDPISLAQLRLIPFNTDIASVIDDYERRHSPAVGARMMHAPTPLTREEARRAVQAVLHMEWTPDNLPALREAMRSIRDRL